MAFSLSCKDITLTDSTLSAQCIASDGSFKSSSIDLNSYLGNDGESFNLEKTGFYASADNVYLKGSVLYASLPMAEDPETKREATLNLNMFIENKDGTLTFIQPQPSILLSCSCFTLDGCTLRAICLGKDGKMHESSIDLGQHYMNNKGSFESVEDRGRYFVTERNSSLEVTSSGIFLKAELKYEGEWHPASIDISICIENRGGQLVYVQHDGPWDRDGIFARFFEPLPLCGFVVAYLHDIAGNEDHAKRAIAKCTNPTVVMVSMMIGACLGGPPGAAIGAAVSTPLGILSEDWLAEHTGIEDPGVRADFEKATVERYIYETLRNTLAAGLAGEAARRVGEKVLKETAGTVATQVTGMLSEKFALELTVDVAGYILLKKIADALVKGEVPDN